MFDTDDISDFTFSKVNFDDIQQTIKLYRLLKIWM